MPTRAASAVDQPDVARRASPQDHLEAVLLDTPARWERHASSSAAEVVSVENGPDGVRATVRETRPGGCGRCALATSWAPTARAAASGARSASPCAGPISSRRRSRCCSARRSGTCSASAATASTTSCIPRRRASSSRPAGTTAGSTARLADPGREPAANFDEERLSELIRLGAGVPDLEPQIERSGVFSFAAQIADDFRHESAFLVGDAAHRVIAARRHRA